MLSTAARIALALTLTRLFLVAAPAEAQTSQPCRTPVLTLTEAAALLRLDEAEVERLAKNGTVPARHVDTTWRFSCDALLAWLAADPQVAPAPEKSPPPQPTIGEAPEQREAEEVLLRGQRVLLDRGEVVLDVAQFYARSAEQVLVGIGGGIGLATVEQGTFATLFTGRVGVFDETELFAGTLFHTRRIRQFFGSTSLASSRESDFAGIQVGVRRTLVREQAGRPDVIFSISGQAPTGDTAAAAGVGVVIVKRVDPVVLFTTANYLRVFARTTTAPETHGHNRLDVSAGYGLALNDTLAISMAASVVLTGSLLLDDVTLRQPGRYSVRFGLTSWLAKGLYIEPSLSFGLAGPGQSFAFGVSVPYTF